MTKSMRRIIVAGAATLFVSTALAGDDPQHERHELMEDVRDAAKVLGSMLKGETEFDNAAAMESLKVWKPCAAQVVRLFPEGSEGGEAAPANWSDRAGFDAALAAWADATDAAIAANPGTLEEGKPVIGAAFGKCKDCHDTYRIEDE